MSKKEETKKVKSSKKDAKKKAPKVKKESYFAGVKSEMAKVKWPTKGEVLKYTISTIIFIIVLVVFFILMSLIMSAIKGAFN
jgi:preprotein translocase subunit SecE